MKITALPLPGLLLIEPTRHGDARGFFAETYSRSRLAEAGFDGDFVQDNHSRTELAGTVRGLHFQAPPHGQAKLVRVVAGAVLDVVVDLRTGSPTYGRSHATELSAADFRQLLVPVGFAHGFMTLTAGAEVLYKVTGYYAPEAEGGLRWDDPAIEADWPTRGEAVTVNARDGAWPLLSEQTSPFVYGQNC